MSTRSAIIAKIDDKYHGIYCHFDGYIDGVGDTLFEHYQDYDKVKSLVSHGDASSLGVRVDPIGPHSYANPEDGTTVFYGRDRSEKDVGTTIGETYEDVASSIGHDGYVYVFEDGKWTVNGCDLESAIKDGDEDEDVK